MHLFVCANRREADAPLGPGCGSAGEGVYAALKEEVASRRAFQTVWVTQTQCLGVCPKRAHERAVGASVDPESLSRRFNPTDECAEGTGI